jgi:1-acyl-sn-glycerol-3-phosphate acyltransferase
MCRAGPNLDVVHFRVPPLAHPNVVRLHNQYGAIILPPIIKAVMKRDWHGQEHIPRHGGVIVAPNHLSYADWTAAAQVEPCPAGTVGP